jgi:hypothetical protein
MRWTIGAQKARFGQRARVAPLSLGATLHFIFDPDANPLPGCVFIVS